MKFFRGMTPRVCVGAIVLLAAAAAGGAPADNPPGVHVWTASEIDAQGKALAGKLDAHKVASATIATEGNTLFMVAHREGSGQSEWHETQADVIMMSEGHVTVTLGGTMVGDSQTAPGERRGSGINGGSDVKLGPGDVIYIPPKTPHLMTLAPGEKVTYFVTKVTK
jgi:mannose-6-phosphate isomerase-like protein (cupin superfamily)